MSDVTAAVLAAEGGGSIEFADIDSGIVAFNKTGIMIGLENGYEVALLTFEVRDGDLVFVSQGVEPFPGAEVSADETMERLIANPFV